MSLKISVKKNTTPQATVTKELKESGKLVAETQEQESPELKVPANMQGEAWCTVGFEASYTHNLGNYQSARVGVFLSIPCPHGEIDSIYDVAKTWVNERMETLIEELSST